jgi:oligopeptide/dipeptide ABC transporter ATP-binding protein
VLEVLLELQQEMRLTYLLISHDLSTIAAFSDEVAVMYLGLIVETGTARQVLSAPAHPYTQALLSASLAPDPSARRQRHLLEGEIPSAIDVIAGCPFASRCPLAMDACRVARPTERPVTDHHRAACVRIDDSSNYLELAPLSERANVDQ